MVQNKNPSIVLQRDACLIRIRSFNKYELMFPYFIEYALETSVFRVTSMTIAIRTHHVIPSGNNGFHVQVTRKKGNNAIRDNLTIFNEDAAKIPNDCRIIPDFKSRTDGNLVTATSNDLINDW